MVSFQRKSTNLRFGRLIKSLLVKYDILLHLQPRFLPMHSHVLCGVAQGNAWQNVTHSNAVSSYSLSKTHAPLNFWNILAALGLVERGGVVEGAAHNALLNNVCKKGPLFSQRASESAREKTECCSNSSVVLDFKWMTRREEGGTAQEHIQCATMHHSLLNNADSVNCQETPYKKKDLGKVLRRLLINPNHDGS